MGWSTMFSSWMSGCCGMDKKSWDDMRVKQLEFLKWVKGNLEAQLAAVGAAIDSLEQQIPVTKPTEVTITEPSESSEPAS